MKERGQLYTLEGIFAGLIILIGLFFAVQATTTTPSAAGASNPHAIEDDDIYVEDVLSSMDRPTLKDAVLYWGGPSTGFHCTPSGVTYYTGDWTSSTCSNRVIDTGEQYPPPNTFGSRLKQHLGDQYSYNVRVAYTTGSDAVKYQNMVYQGEPGIGAVRSTTSVVLKDTDQALDSQGNDRCAIGDGSCDYFAPETVTTNELYTVVHVEVVTWRG